MAIITNDQIELYREQGWVVVEGVYDENEIDRVVEEAMAISQKELDEGITTDTVDRSEDGTLAPRKLDKPFLKSERIREMALDKELLDILEALLGYPGLLVTEQIFMKPPRFGSAKPYHQDNAYFCCSPEDEVITAWIALDDVDEENGCLRYISGSQKMGLVPHTSLPGEEHNKVPSEEYIDYSKEVLAPVKKGGVVFHHGYVLHTSYRNESDRWRRAYATHWVTANVTSTTDILTTRARFNSELYPKALA